MVNNMNSVRYSVSQLERFCCDAFEKFGFTHEEAAQITDVLLLADLYGVSSHGMQRLVRYHKSIEKDCIKVKAKPEIVFETPVSAVIDGHAAMGQLVSVFAMNKAIEKAKQVGMAFVTVRNSNHFGIAGYYSKMACDAGLIGISATNSQSIMVHTGSREAILGSNPIAFAMPADPIPFWFDAATTVVPKGKLEVYNKADKPLKAGWAADENGAECTDAEHALKCIDRIGLGGILPVGGAEEASGSHKGYGYGMLCEIFSSIFSGGMTSNHTHQNGKGGTCHGFMAIDPKVFGDAEAMKERFSTFLQELRDAPKAEGAERIYTHGEKEIIASADRMANGIDVNINTVAEMKDLCDYLGMDSVEYLGDVDFSTATQSSYK